MKRAILAASKPTDEMAYSGKFLMRVPKRLHAEMAKAAKSQGVSLNQYVLYLLPSGTRRARGLHSASSYLVGRESLAKPQGQPADDQLLVPAFAGRRDLQQLYWCRHCSVCCVLDGNPDAAGLFGAGEALVTSHTSGLIVSLKWVNHGRFEQGAAYERACNRIRACNNPPRLHACFPPEFRNVHKPPQSPALGLRSSRNPAMP